MFPRFLMGLTFLFSCLCSIADSGNSNNLTHSTNFIEGTHYTVLEQPLPQGVSPVIEFMYFGCKVCFQLVPAIADWSYKTGIGVALVPAHSDSSMVEEARMFHTFEQMSVLEEMYEDGYVIFQTNLSNLQGADRVNSFLNGKGINKDEFWKVWQSGAVNQRLNDSALLTKQVQISKTPTFVVHGIYKVDVESLKTVDELFDLLTFLVAKKTNKAPPLLRKNS
jgi:thiol:disulfide interchange protein DsbA